MRQKPAKKPHLLQKSLNLLPKKCPLLRESTNKGELLHKKGTKSWSPTNCPLLRGSPLFWRTYFGADMRSKFYRLLFPYHILAGICGFLPVWNYSCVCNLLLCKSTLSHFEQVWDFIPVWTKSCVTFWADMWFFYSVDQSMSFQIPLRCECLVTFWAGIWLFASVE